MTEVEHSANIEAQIKKHNKILRITLIVWVISIVILVWISHVTHRDAVTHNASQVESMDNIGIPGEPVMDLENAVIDIIAVPTVLVFVVLMLVCYFEMDLISKLQKQQKQTC